MVIEILHKAVRDTNRYGHWKASYSCDCGKIFLAYPYDVKRGFVKSCGCLRIKTTRLLGEKNVVHGYARGKKTPTYISWRAMVQRCTDPRTIGWKNYGGRGIKVCDRWRSFENFLKDMGNRPQGTWIDRINNEGNYEPGNCRWVTPKSQAQNRRPRCPSQKVQVVK